MSARRGFTMVEMLVVISIIGLLTAAMVVFLLGSDDRRCRLEAERLAAFIQSASAEAVMRDGPVRVEVDLDEQRCTREVSEEGAELRVPSWSADPRADPFESRKPVRVSEFSSPDGTRKDGTGWILFAGRRSRGAVLLVSLEEIEYSVVVPGGDQPVEVKHGRVAVPDPPAPPALPGDAPKPLVALSEGGRGDGVGAGGGAGLPPEPAKNDLPVPQLPSNTPPPPQAAPEDMVPPEGFDPEAVVDPDPVAPAAVAPADPEVPQEPEPEPEEPEPEEPEPDPPVDPTEEGQCEGNDDCPGRWAYCPPAGVEPRTCARFPAGVSFYVNRIQVTEPNAVADFLTVKIQEQIDAGLFVLYVAFSGAPGELSKPADAPRDFYLAQAMRANNVTTVSPLLPSIPLRNAQPLSELSWAVQAPQENAFGKTVSLYLVNLQSNPSCDFAAVTVVANVVAQVTSADQPGRLRLTVTGALRKDDASQFKMNMSGQNRGLDWVLENANIPRVIDSNSDNVPDAWGFNFTGNAIESQLMGDPALAVGNDPCP